MSSVWRFVRVTLFTAIPGLVAVAASVRPGVVAVVAGVVGGALETGFRTVYPLEAKPAPPASPPSTSSSG